MFHTVCEMKLVFKRVLQHAGSEYKSNCAGHSEDIVNYPSPLGSVLSNVQCVQLHRFSRPESAHQ